MSGRGVTAEEGKEERCRPSSTIAAMSLVLRRFRGERLLKIATKPTFEQKEKKICGGKDAAFGKEEKVPGPYVFEKTGGRNRRTNVKAG